MNNEPAFPAPDRAEYEFGEINRGVYSGMTLRDYFASNATDKDIAPYLNDYENLTHIPAGHSHMTGSYAARSAPTRRSIETARYMFADAMLKARVENE